MATPTYDLLDSTTLGTSAASVTFSGISGDYRDLVLVMECGGTAGNVIRETINGDSTDANYSYVYMLGDGSSATSASGTGRSFGITGLSGAKGLSVVQFLDYSATDKHKTYLTRKNLTTYATEAGAIRWANTSAITSIAMARSSGNFEIGDTFYLYGVAS